MFACEERGVIGVGKVHACELIGLLLTSTVLFSGGIPRRGGVEFAKYLLGKSRRAARKKI
jgi:hypothetical protein